MANIAYRIFYTGAPYGDDEQGKVISTHKTSASALKKWQDLQKQARYYKHLAVRDSNNNRIDIGDLI